MRCHFLQYYNMLCVCNDWNIRNLPPSVEITVVGAGGVTGSVARAAVVNSLVANGSGVNAVVDKILGFILVKF